MAEWDRDAALLEIKRGDLPEHQKIIKRMHVFWFDMQKQMQEYAHKKTEFDRLRSRIIVQMRQEGEKSYDVCSNVADMDQAVHDAHLAYRLAEQLIAADKSALQICHAELDAWQTGQADARAADSFQARNST
jgi:hypothetical protein